MKESITLTLMATSVDRNIVHTIPVYDGLTAEQSWGLIRDGGHVPEYISGRPVEGWANILVDKSGNELLHLVDEETGSDFYRPLCGPFIAVDE